MNETRKGNEKKHICLECGKAFPRPYRLKQHEKVHQNIKAFVCGEPNCNKSYTNKSHLDRHIQTVHIERTFNVLYNCPECRKMYANRQNLKRHIKIAHNRKTWFNCDVCSASFKKKHTLNAHMYGHTYVKSFSCDLCSKEFITLMEKRKHMKHHKTYSCELCDMAFDQWTRYQKHKKDIHLFTEYTCDDCGRKFNKRIHMVRHTKSHEDNNIPTFQCTFENCEKIYTRSSNLKQHIKIQHLKIKYDCEICGASLSTKAKLTQHLLAHTKPKTSEALKKDRQERCDKGTQKVSTALRIAGLILDPEDENIKGTLKDTSSLIDNVPDEIVSENIEVSGSINLPADNLANIVLKNTAVF